MAKQTAAEVADYLTQCAIADNAGELLTNLKLQKLLYYAQGCYLAIYGEPLFDESLEAWDLGPVVPNIYHAFKVCGRQPIEDISGDEIDIAVDVADFLNVIFEKFGQYSAGRLIDMTHKEAPWIDHYVSNMSVEIDKKTMKEFFEKNWVDPDLNVETDGIDDDLIEKILAAAHSAAEKDTVPAEELEKWLETA
ncbi:MAG: DUF4065 domain-containing protein [Proteobacteria bacterium]|nr:DUF4065 domain-containing protein [Pseudomonadota bacterium]